MGVIPLEKDSIFDMSFPIRKTVICSFALTKYSANSLDLQERSPMNRLQVIFLATSMTTLIQVTYAPEKMTNAVVSLRPPVFLFTYIHAILCEPKPNILQSPD